MLHLTPGVMIKGSVLNSLADIFQRNHDSREFWLWNTDAFGLLILFYDPTYIHRFINPML